ncbi:MAG: Holliday junction branch migration protein RuvA, partial [Clostridia bacterium]|nr:Holliday junction branch migration protein RuvA [Clostridia bacterium]
SAAVYQKLINDKKGEVYTYLAVREDGVSLYGFISPEEKNMFLKLISVSGVGPKMGITVLSNMKLDDLAVKIATSDVKGLSSVKGLGKKTAERIILELREKISAEQSETVSGSSAVEEPIDGDNQDAVIALMSLGFTRQECVKAVKAAKENGAETIQQLISFALKFIK